MYKLALILALCACLTEARGGPSMLGGRKSMDLKLESNQKKVKELVDYGLSTLAEHRMKENVQKALKPLKYEPVKVVNVQSQVVAGANYFIKLRFKEANCTENCDEEECTLTIWEKPWENFRNLTEVVCKKKATPGFGARRKLSTSNKEALKALHFAVLKKNQESNDLFYSRPVEVSKVYKQIVNGVKYSITYKFGQTECKKNQKMESQLQLSECPAMNEDKAVECKVVVLSKPWLTEENVKYEIMNHDCGESNE